jgi:hypothetical protein
MCSLQSHPVIIVSAGADASAPPACALARIVALPPAPVAKPEKAERGPVPA